MTSSKQSTAAMTGCEDAPVEEWGAWGEPVAADLAGVHRVGVGTRGHARSIVQSIVRVAAHALNMTDAAGRARFDLCLIELARPSNFI